MKNLILVLMSMLVIVSCSENIPTKYEQNDDIYLHEHIKMYIRTDFDWIIWDDINGSYFVHGDMDIVYPSIVNIVHGRIYPIPCNDCPDEPRIYIMLAPFGTRDTIYQHEIRPGGTIGSFVGWKNENDRINFDENL